MDPTNGKSAGVNRLIDGLPPLERQMVIAEAEQIRLTPGELVCKAGRKVKHVLFPRSGIISLFAAAESGRPEVGVAIVGAAGMFGLAAASARSASTLLAVSFGRGSADRIEAVRFRELLGSSAGLREAMFVYGHELSAQLAQNAACALLHSTPRRLSRWLLDVSADSPDGRLSSTQASIAIALGVQRSAVNHAAGSLQALGIIRYTRGEMSILDRPSLVAAACACTRKVPKLRAAKIA